MASTNTNAATTSDDDEEIRRRRQFTQELNLRRQVYRELTTYQVFPLQEMAMKDLHEKLKDYLSSGVDKLDSTVGKSVGETDLGVIGSESCNVAKTDETEPCDYNDLDRLREKYLHDFLTERSIPPVDVTSVAAAVVLPEEESNQNEGQDKCDSGSPKQHDSPLDNEQDSHQTAERGQYEQSGQTNITECLVDSQENLQEQQQQNLSFIPNPKPPNEQQSCNSADNREDKQIQQDEDLLRKTNISSPTEHQCNTIPTTTFLPLLWSMEPRIFAFETSSTGRRRYISAHLGRFMDHYWRECDSHSRHYYELIRENTPCRLYLGQFFLFIIV
jgi:hypothetical protein